VGGWSVPLDSRHTTAEMAAALALPVVLVVGIRLGCLNHALLTAAAIEQSRLPLRAWVANQIDPQCLRVQQIIHSLEERLAAPCIGRVPYMDPPNPSQVSALLDLSPILGHAR
jgi:dethiobiotin synthetase